MDSDTIVYATVEEIIGKTGKNWVLSASEVISHVQTLLLKPSESE